MIQCQLLGPDEVHDQYVSFPGIPRVGEKLVVGFCTHQLRVIDIIYYGNIAGVQLWVEFVVH